MLLVVSFMIGWVPKTLSWTFNGVNPGFTSYIIILYSLFGAFYRIINLLSVYSIYSILLDVLYNYWCPAPISIW